MRHECGLPQFDQQLDIQDRWVILGWCLDDLSVFGKTYLVVWKLGRCLDVSVFGKTSIGTGLVVSLRRRLRAGRRVRGGCLFKNLLNSGTIKRGCESMMDSNWLRKWFMFWCREYHGITRGFVAQEVFRRVEPAGRTIGQFLRCFGGTTWMSQYLSKSTKITTNIETAMLSNPHWWKFHCNPVDINVIPSTPLTVYNPPLN